MSVEDELDLGRIDVLADADDHVLGAIDDEAESLVVEPGDVAGAAPSEAELQDWVRERLAGFKVPVQVRFADAMLPRNANGKILKAELRGLFAPVDG